MSDDSWIDEDIRGRVPVNNLDAEAAVIGAILLHPKALELVAGTLRAEHFYSGPNQAIYAAICELAQRRIAIDVVSVANLLEEQDKLKDVGGRKYLTMFVDATPAVHNIEAHAWIVVSKFVQRSVGAIGHKIAAQSYFDVGDPIEWATGIQRELQELATAKRVKSGEYVGEVLRRLFAQQTEDPDGATGRRMPTGYSRYDEKTVGNKRGRVTVVAGRPGSGKSSWSRGAAVGVAKNVRDEETGVVIFSMEMTKEEVAMYMLCSEASVDARRWENNLLLPAEWSALTEAAARIAHLGIVIDDTSSLSIADIRSRLAQYAADYDTPEQNGRPGRKIGVVVVDYIQLMKGSGRRGQSRQQEIGENSRGLKQLAKEFGVWVIELAQMNRDAEREKREPQLSDLRESGDIEADADEVTFIHQPYEDADGDSEGKRGRKQQDYQEPDEKGVAKVIIRKQRGGPKATVKMRWFPEYTRFSDTADDYERFGRGQ